MIRHINHDTNKRPPFSFFVNKKQKNNNTPLWQLQQSDTLSQTASSVMHTTQIWQNKEEEKNQQYTKYTSMMLCKQTLMCFEDSNVDREERQKEKRCQRWEWDVKYKENLVFPNDPRPLNATPSQIKVHVYSLTVRRRYTSALESKTSFSRGRLARGRTTFYVTSLRSSLFFSKQSLKEQPICSSSKGLRVERKKEKKKASTSSDMGNRCLDWVAGSGRGYTTASSTE